MFNLFEFYFFIFTFLFLLFPQQNLNKLSSSTSQQLSNFSNVYSNKQVNEIENLKSIPKIKSYFIKSKEKKEKITNITIAEPFYFVMEIELRENYRIIPPNLENKVKDIEIFENSTEIKKEEKNKKFQKKNQKSIQFIFYQIKTYQVGKLVIPPMKIEFIDKDNVLVLKNAKKSIDVISVLTAEEKVNDEIKNIETIIEYELLNKNFWFIIIILILSIILVGVFIYFFVKYLSKPKPYYILILKELEKITKKNILEKTSQKKYYYVFSDLIVRYLSEEKIILNSMSSKQILKSIKNRNYLNFSFYENFFQKADLIKFAKHEVDNEKTIQLTNDFKKILKERCERSEKK